MSFLEKAKKIQIERDATCVIASSEGIIISNDHGILPIMKQLEEKPESLNGAGVADKVIGKSAALLFIYGKVKDVYGEVMSEHAVEVLRRYDISFSYGKKVPYIINRKRDGMCPMEKLVLDIEDPKTAYEILAAKGKKGERGE